MVKMKSFKGLHVYDILKVDVLFKALVHLLNILIMCVRTCTTSNTFFFIFLFQT